MHRANSLVVSVKGAVAVFHQKKGENVEGQQGTANIGAKNGERKPTAIDPL